MIFLSLIIFFLLFYLITPFIIRLGLIDKNKKNIENNPIPLAGGIYIYFSSLITYLIFYSNDIFFLILLTLFFLIFLGIIDDLKNISFKIRFIIQILFITFIVYYFNLTIKNYGVFSINYQFFYISFIFTVLAILALTNAFNFIDGIDGLSSGIFISVLLIIKMYHIVQTGSLVLHQIDILLILVFLFFLINSGLLNLKKIYLGDSGSMLLGFLCAFYLIYYSNFVEIIEPTLVFWLVTIPVFDSISVFLKRLKKNTNPMIGDEKHIHHDLINLGFSKKTTLILLLILTFLFSFFGIILDYFNFYLFSIYSYLFFLVTYIILKFRIEKKKN